MTNFIHSPETKAFFDAFHNGENIFLTGPGGVGKTYLIETLLQNSVVDISVTASTGVAALKIGGSTIHRWAGMMLGPKPGQTNEAYFTELLLDKRTSVRRGFNRIRSCTLLFIDEISMLSGRTFDFLEFLCRKVRGNETPFGGIRVVASGDFLQLPPVRKIPTVPYDWAFQTEAWERAKFLPIYLRKIHRQANQEFIQALSAFRLGEVSGRHAKLLQSRVCSFPNADITRLYTHNSQVDRWNLYRLAELPGEEHSFDAAVKGPDTQQQFLTQNLLTPRELRLKVGSKVMFTVNQPDAGFVNGQIGTVTALRRDFLSTSIKVDCEGRSISVDQFTWRYDSNDPLSATFTQYPLRLSYAMTIHKAQGLSMDTAYIDVRAAREPGQAYVALSRVRSLEGLFLKDWFTGVVVSRSARQFYEHVAPGTIPTAAPLQPQPSIVICK